MSNQKRGEKFTRMVSDSFEKTDEKCTYEVPFRQWLVREIEEQNLTIIEAIKRFNFHPQKGRDLIRSWRKKYAPAMVLS